MKKRMVTFRLPEDTVEVLKSVSAAHGLSQAQVADKAIVTELIAMMAAEKPADVIGEYQKWREKNKC